MASYKVAIEKALNIENAFYKEQGSIFDNKFFCDKKYATFKIKTDKEIFNSEFADRMFESIWLKNNYDLISSQEIANKLFEISSSLSAVVAKNIAEAIIKRLEPKFYAKKDVVLGLNLLCEQGLENKMMCLLRQMQKDYYINMISQRPEESNYLAFLLSKTYS